MIRITTIWYYVFLLFLEKKPDLYQFSEKLNAVYTFTWPSWSSLFIPSKVRTSLVSEITIRCWLFPKKIRKWSVHTWDDKNHNNLVLRTAGASWCLLKCHSKCQIFWTLSSLESLRCHSWSRSLEASHAGTNRELERSWGPSADFATKIKSMW